MTPLETALKAWLACEQMDSDDVGRKDWALQLAQTEQFSISHVCAITGAPLWFVQTNWSKSLKTGGRFNPEALPQILDLSIQRALGARPVALTAGIIRQGVSPVVLARLTGIPLNTIRGWVTEAAR